MIKQLFRKTSYLNVKAITPGWFCANVLPSLRRNAEQSSHSNFVSCQCNKQMLLVRIKRKQLQSRKQGDFQKNVR